MKEGPFERGGAVAVGSVSMEMVHSAERDISGDMPAVETHSTLSHQLADLSQSPAWQAIEQLERTDLTALERVVLSNRAQAATFLKTAEGQMEHLDVLREHGTDTATHEAHIAQSLRIVQLRLAEAIAALEHVPARPRITESSEGVVPTEVMATVDSNQAEAGEETVTPEREEGNPAIAGIDLITAALEGVTKAGIRSEAHAEVSELIRLRADLIALDRRYQNFTQGTHAESDRVLRDLLTAQTRTRIEKTILKAQEYLDRLSVITSEAVVALPAVREADATDAVLSESPREEVASSSESEPANEVLPEMHQEIVLPPDAPISNPVVPSTATEAAPVEVSVDSAERERGQMLAEKYMQVLRDVKVLRQMPTRIISGSKEFPEILASREVALVEQKKAYDAIIEKNPSVIDSNLQAEVQRAEAALMPPTLKERLVAVKESIQSVSPTLGKVKKLKAEAPMNPDVLLHEPVSVEQTNDPFTHLPAVIDASVKDVVVEDAKVEAMETLMDALNETVSIATSEKTAAAEIGRAEISEAPRTLESLKIFIQNYGDNAEVFQHDFDAWVDTVQDVHPSRWRLISRFGSGDTHRDAFEAFKQLTVGEFRDMIRMPEPARQSKFEQLKIQPEDFEKWRHEFTYSTMVDGVRDSLHNPNTSFEDWARYTFAAAKIAEQQFS